MVRRDDGKWWLKIYTYIYGVKLKTGIKSLKKIFWKKNGWVKEYELCLIKISLRFFSNITISIRD